MFDDVASAVEKVIIAIDRVVDEVSASGREEHKNVVMHWRKPNCCQGIDVVAWGDGTKQAVGAYQDQGMQRAGTR
jgi:hypothetical protein